MDDEMVGDVYLLNGKPKMVLDWGGHGKWLFYWHPQGNWVSERPISEVELLTFPSSPLPREQAKLYHDQHARFLSQIEGLVDHMLEIDEEQEEE